MYHLPSDDTPLLHGAHLHSSTARKAVIRVRGNAMGRHTALHWRLDGGEWMQIPMGWETTPVHRYVTVAEPGPGDHRVDVTLKSDAGESAVRSVNWTSSPDTGEKEGQA